MNWTAKPTGDMTLSVVDENGNQIIKIDMLSANTMKAETNGDLLVKALNDLNIIANFSKGDYDISPDNRIFAEGDISELPWTINYNSDKRKLVVKGAKKKIADKDFPRTYSDEMVKEIVDTIEKGIEIINKNS